MLTSSFAASPVRAVLFADGVFGHLEGKTAHGILRHSTVIDPVAVVDRSHRPETTAAMVPGTDVPVVDSVAEALRYRPDALVMAMTESDFGESGPDGFVRDPREPGDIPEFWWDALGQAARAGLHLISCLHQQLRETPLAGLLAEGRQIIDVRRPSPTLPKYSGRAPRSRARVVHVAGSDCVVGKRTAALQIHREARARGVVAGYVGTGQTCLLTGCVTGAIVDRTPVFQAAGLVEHLVQEAEADHDLLIIKGQASVLHPAFGGLATAILQGSQPDAVVFAHDPGRKARYHWEHLAVGAVEEEIALVEQLGGAPVVALATKGAESVRQLRHLGLPVADVLDADGPGVLTDAVWQALGRPCGARR
ncbi:DUF1611 domain-containing protein [Streptomyces sp. NPDC014733]|uniref:DUF1611 domain-containing protein n=1 Tax=Streptomyces sp. NPDC014733 TaxID=3364885 RepID=UPI003700C636